MNIKGGDIVSLKKWSNTVAEVVTVVESKALVRLCNCGLEVSVDLEELEPTNAFQPHYKSGTVVHILGVPYKILIIEEGDWRYSKDADGWCDNSTKELLVYDYKQSIDSKGDLRAYQRKVIRHEIVHAFLYESGLAENSSGVSSWAKNEEMVDWIAIQAPKLFEAFAEAGVLDGKEVV